MNTPLQADASGNSYAVSNSNTGVNFYKMDPAGNIVNQNSFTGFFKIRDIAVDSNGDVCIIGYVTSNTTIGGTTVSVISNPVYSVLKLSSTGNPIWFKGFSSSGGGGLLTHWAGIDITGTDIYVTGSYTGTTSFGGISKTHPNDGSGAFVAKINAAGTTQWVTVGNTSVPGSPTWTTYATGSAVTILSDGNIAISGVFADGIQFTGGSLITGVDNFDSFVVKFNAGNGSLIWEEHFSGDDDEFLFDIDSDSNGNILVVGKFDEDISLNGQSVNATGTSDDGILYSINASTGNKNWHKLIASGRKNWINAVVVDAQ